MKAPDTGITSNTKAAMIELLNARLADAIDLALITKQAHWNLKGPTFIAVHEFLDEVRDDIDEHVDIIAERVAQLEDPVGERGQRACQRKPGEPSALVAAALEGFKIVHGR